MQRWRNIENAKHRLIYQLLRMRLPLVNKQQDEQTGLVFDFMADEKTEDEKGYLPGMIMDSLHSILKRLMI